MFGISDLSRETQVCIQQGSMLAVNEASLPCLLCLQINKEKIGDFLNFK